MNREQTLLKSTGASNMLVCFWIYAVQIIVLLAYQQQQDTPILKRKINVLWRVMLYYISYK
jgi:hypothetical protein